MPVIRPPIQVFKPGPGGARRRPEPFANFKNPDFKWRNRGSDYYGRRAYRPGSVSMEGPIPISIPITPQQPQHYTTITMLTMIKGLVFLGWPQWWKSCPCCLAHGLVAVG